MKRIIVFCIALLVLAGCGAKEAAAPQVQMDARAEVTAVPAAPTAAPQALGSEETALPEITTEPAPEVTEAPTPEPAPQESGLVSRLIAAWTQEGFLDALYPMDSEDVLDLYGIDFSACKSGAAFGDAVGYTNEAVIVEADGAVLDEVETMLKTHLEAVKAQFKGYDPEALALAEKAVLVREGDEMLFVISPHAEEMLSAFRDLTK